MTGRVWIGPYKPLGARTQAVPGGDYLNVDASVGQFGGSGPATATPAWRRLCRRILRPTTKW